MVYQKKFFKKKISIGKKRRKRSSITELPGEEVKRRGRCEDAPVSRLPKKCLCDSMRKKTGNSLGRLAVGTEEKASKGRVVRRTNSRKAGKKNRSPHFQPNRAGKVIEKTGIDLTAGECGAGMATPSTQLGVEGM